MLLAILRRKTDDSHRHHHDHDHDLDASQVSAEGRSFFGWILPGSVVLHVVVAFALPSASSSSSRQPLMAVTIEMAEPPPPPPPMPTEPPKEPAPSVAPPPSLAAPRPIAPTAATTTTAPTRDDPLDFTSTMLSNDGPGMPIASRPAPSPSPAQSASPPPGRAIATRSSASTPDAPVPAASLGRPPRAPGLDAELERNYPLEARRSGISGTAVLRVMISADGRVGRVDQVSETHPGFAVACERTVRAGRWEPPLDRDGHPVGTEIKYVCKFEVRS